MGVAKQLKLLLSLGSMETRCAILSNRQQNEVQQANLKRISNAQRLFCMQIAASTRRVTESVPLPTWIVWADWVCEIDDGGCIAGYS